MLLDIALSWTNADGSPAAMTVANNIEAFASGNPVFAWSGDDTLTGSAGDDLFVFSQPIGADMVYSFDAAHDRIDLIGYSDLATFADVQAHMADDGAGNALITLGDSQSITLQGVSASTLTAGNFLFDEQPHLTNNNTITIGDGAMLPLSGTIDNSGTITLDSTGSHTELQLIQYGITLQGGGAITLSDNAANVITGTVDSVTLTNVDNVISGAGQIGNGQLTLVNGGTIVATGTNALVIDTGDHAVVNTGVIEATGSGGLTVLSVLENSGTLWAHGGNLTLDGAVSGEGDAVVSGTAMLTFGAAASIDTILDHDATATITLQDATDFTGTFSGFNNDDLLDLRDIGFGADTSLSYAMNGDGTGGVLTVSDGAHTANIELLGIYAADEFNIAADAHLGTLVTYGDHILPL